MHASETDAEGKAERKKKEEEEAEARDLSKCQGRSDRSPVEGTTPLADREERVRVAGCPNLLPDRPDRPGTRSGFRKLRGTVKGDGEESFALP